MKNYAVRRHTEIGNQFGSSPQKSPSNWERSYPGVRDAKKYSFPVYKCCDCLKVRENYWRIRFNKLWLDISIILKGFRIYYVTSIFSFLLRYWNNFEVFKIFWFSLLRYQNTSKPIFMTTTVECGSLILLGGIRYFHYCYHCGAKRKLRIILNATINI